jgi:hypothetical protein
MIVGVDVKVDLTKKEVMKEVKEIVGNYVSEREKELVEIKELADEIQAIRDTVKDSKDVHIPLYIEPEKIDAAAKELKSFFGTVPEKTILCSSSMARYILKLAKLEKVAIITTELQPNQKLPYFYLAELNEEKVIIVDELQSGEDKYPEFYPILPLRALILSGASQFFIVSEALSASPLIKPGDVFLFRNYIPMNFVNPFIGKHIEDWGDRFLDVTAIFNPEVNEAATEIMEDTLPMITENVIWVNPKKTFGDKAEITMAQSLRIPIISDKGMLPAFLCHDMKKNFISVGIIKENLNFNTSITNEIRKDTASKLTKLFAINLKTAKP